MFAAFILVAKWHAIPSLVRACVFLGVLSLGVFWARTLVDHRRIQELLGKAPLHECSAELLKVSYLWTNMANDILTVVIGAWLLTLWILLGAKS